jgi:hypothetical protein
VTLPIDSLATYIATDLAIGTVGTNVFKQSLPDQPDTAVCIYDTGGGPPTLVTRDDTDSPSWQVLSRSLDASTALTNLQTIFRGLHGITETTTHGLHIKLLWAMQSNPVSLGRDEKQRFQFVMNFRAYVTGQTR